MSQGKKILILGGTAEAAELASRAVETLGDAEVITSLAGRTRDPAALAGRVVTGGFGGISGLKDFIETEGIDIVVDATHPFAETISDSAYVACTVTGTLRVMLIRPAWNLPSGGKWVEVESLESAAESLAGIAKRVFLTIGTRGIEKFSGLEDIWFLVRLIEEPETPLALKNYETVISRPPHDLETERRLLAEYEIDCLVSKHSGGEATEAKITAALQAGVAVVLIKRPPRLPGLWSESVDECVEWLAGQM